MKTFVKAQNLKKIYNTGKMTVNALNGIDFEICEGEFAVILGQSGAGKTTLLNVIGGMDSISEGDLFVDGTNFIAKAKGDDMYKNIDDCVAKLASQLRKNQ